MPGWVKQQTLLRNQEFVREIAWLPRATRETLADESRSKATIPPRSFRFFLTRLKYGSGQRIIIIRSLAN